MYSNIRKLFLMSSIALAVAGSTSALAADPASQKVTDARQETQIWTTYALSPYLRDNDLKVSVNNGKATLSGTVGEGVDKDLAKQIALGVNGVNDVDNNIVVKPDYTPPARSSERTFSDKIEDASVTAKVKSKLMWSTYTSGWSTDVDTNMGKVTLKGETDTAASKELAGALAKNTRGVRSVDNRLVVEPEKASAARASKGSAHAKSEHPVSDAWISTKVKSTLLYSRNVDGSDIDVSTKNGVVTLSGEVTSGAERALAIELAKNIRGVQSVESKVQVI